jgi:hypothetical protein
MTSNAAIKQRADYTFKYNRDAGRHGWLRLTPAYSVKLVEEILENAPYGSRILDPFAGTATTPLCAVYRDFPAVGIELNPFLVWFAQAKTDIYDETAIREVAAAGSQIVEILSKEKTPSCTLPPIHNIERWWNPAELEFLCRLKTCITDQFRQPSPTKTLLLVCFCRLVIMLSNAAFNHQSMSFKDEAAGSQQLELIPSKPDLGSVFLKELDRVLEGARQNPPLKPDMIQGDARNLQKVTNQRYDLLITSPPYPNRISYIRELRPYMYWLEYLTNGREAGDLDWQAIGGTWGGATSRLADWQRNPDGFYPDYLSSLLNAVAHADNKNGKLLSNYIAKYFEDIWLHLQGVCGVMSPGGRVHYIVGNSTFYNILLPVEKIYKDMLQTLGFTEVAIKTLRKRNSKKELYEFDVTATKGA